MGHSTKIWELQPRQEKAKTGRARSGAEEPIYIAKEDLGSAHHIPEPPKGLSLKDRSNFPTASGEFLDLVNSVQDERTN